MAGFAIDLIAYVHESIGNAPLCGHDEDEEPSDEEKEFNDENPGSWPDDLIIFCR
jgi:hypothetical protein